MKFLTFFKTALLLSFSIFAINQRGISQTPGTQKWAFITGGAVSSSPAIGADGTVYAGSLDGKLYAINPNGTQ